MAEEMNSSAAAPKAKRGGGVWRRERCKASLRALGGRGRELRAQPAAPPPERKAGAGRREREEAEGGGGRRAERLFVVRFDPEGEPETLTFLA